MIAWDYHPCRRNHATAKGFLRCKVRNAAWITGAGDYALIAWCGQPTATLWHSPTEALDAENLLHATRCGTHCRQAHGVVYIDLEPTRRKATA